MEKKKGKGTVLLKGVFDRLVGSEPLCGSNTDTITKWVQANVNESLAKEADEGGVTALMMACDKGRAGAVRHLLGLGADPWRRMMHTGNQAVHFAAHSGDLETLREVVANADTVPDETADCVLVGPAGAKLGIDAMWATILELIKSKGDARSAQPNSKLWAGVNSAGDTPLMVAAASSTCGGVNILRYIIEREAARRSKPPGLACEGIGESCLGAPWLDGIQVGGDSTLTMALFRADTEKVECLLAAGASPFALKAPQGVAEELERLARRQGPPAFRVIDPLKAANKILQDSQAAASRCEANGNEASCDAAQRVADAKLCLELVKNRRASLEAAAVEESTAAAERAAQALLASIPVTKKGTRNNKKSKKKRNAGTKKNLEPKDANAGPVQQQTYVATEPQISGREHDTVKAEAGPGEGGGRMSIKRTINARR